MEFFKENEPKTKRVRLNPVRKWTLDEERALIDFLQENINFEKPTAQTFYKCFCLEKNVAVEWTQARAKVRNMRVSYNKAKAWEGSTGAGSMEGDTIKNSLLKMCAYYDELDDIFRGRVIDCTIIEDSLDSGNEMLLNSTEIVFEESTTDASTLDSAPSTSSKRKGIYSRTAVSELMQMQNEFLEIKKQKLDYDKGIKEREINVMEKTMALNEKELELKEKEIQAQRELKIMELQVKERLAMEELKLKYK